MINNEYFKFYEILFSLRKEYLKNQEIINNLLSHIKIANNSLNDYSSNLIFKTRSREKIDSLLLIIKKRQSCIGAILNSLYNSLVDSDSSYLKSGIFSFDLRLSENYVYLLDNDQDGRYLDSKVTVDNPKEFIELYKILMDNVICKNGSVDLDLKKSFLKLNNNGIHLSHIARSNPIKNIILDYDGIVDNIMINNASYIGNIMGLKINKDIIPIYFRNIIDNNMEDYKFIIEKQDNVKKSYYEIENFGKKLILRVVR